GSEAGLGADLPVRYTVVAPGHGQVRKAPSVLDAHEQNRFLAHLTRAGIEHRVRRVRPVPGREDRVGAMATEQLFGEIRYSRFSKHSVILLGWRPSSVDRLNPRTRSTSTDTCDSPQTEAEQDAHRHPCARKAARITEPMLSDQRAQHGPGDGAQDGRD